MAGNLRLAVFTDDYNRANGAPGANYTAYTGGGGDLEILNNELAGPAENSENSTAVTGAAPNANQYAQMTVRLSGSGLEHSSLLIRSSQPASRNYYEFLIRGSAGNSQLYRVAAGVRTSLAVVSDPGWVDGDLMLFEAFGITLTCYRNGAPIAGLLAVDATYATGIVGILIHNEGTQSQRRFDNLEIGNVFEPVGGTVPADEMRYLARLRRGY